MHANQRLAEQELDPRLRGGDEVARVLIFPGQHCSGMTIRQFVGLCSLSRAQAPRNRPHFRATTAPQRRCPALLAIFVPACSSVSETQLRSSRARTSMCSNMHAFPPKLAALLGAADGTQDQERASLKRCASVCRLCGQDGRSTGPLSGGGRAENKARRGEHTDVLAFAQRRMRCRRTLGARTRTWRAEPGPDLIGGCPEGARPGCPSLGLPSLGQAREGNSSRPQDGSKRSRS